ncbi:hypothetical protein ACA910_014187 [Epithemia clementina (nom. ined.)]
MDAAEVKMHLMRKTMGNQLTLLVSNSDETQSHTSPASSSTGSTSEPLDTEVETSMTSAIRVVQDVLDQLSLRDFPPTNAPRPSLDPVLSPSMSVDRKTQFDFGNNSTTESVNQSQNNATTNRSFINSAASFETDESSMDRSCKSYRVPPEKAGLDEAPPQQFSEDHPVTKYRKICSDAIQKGDLLGQGSLESLCEWTLDTFEMRAKQTQALKPTNGETRPVPTTISPTNKGGPWHRRKTKNKKKAESQKFTSSKVRLQMFGSEYARHILTKPASPTGVPTKHKKRKPHQPPKILGRPLFLDETYTAIQTGAVLDIVVTSDDHPPPIGYYRLRQGDDAFQLGRGRSTWHMDIKKEPNWDKAAQRPCVTALTVIFPDRNEFIPPGFSVVRDGKNRKSPSEECVGEPADIGITERVFLCFRRSREGNPITGIVPLSPADGDFVPEGYTVLERTPRNFVADLNQGSTGKPLFLAIRQRLANLEALRPLPLVLAVKRNVSESDSIFRGMQHNPMTCTNSTTDNFELNGYYSTSGSVTPAIVGHFHVLDRSTHTLLSPSSVTNRLSLIKKSREKAGKTVFSDTASKGPATPNSRERRSSSGVSSAGRLKHEMYSLPQTVLPEDDVEYRRLLNALDFIPEVEVAAKHDARAPALFRHQARITLIVPILTACYTRHGGSALRAVDGLYSLLTNTDFFEDDVVLSDDTDHESCSRFTLLDLAIQVVCDVAASGTLEPTFMACTEFVSEAVQFSHAQLNTRTIGYVVRFYFFVFYFGASSPTIASDWPASCWEMVKTVKETDDDFTMLFDPRKKDEGCPYFPGGAPQAAVLAFKELISLSIIRLGKTAVKNCVALSVWERGSSDKENKTLDSLLDSVLSTVVDNAVDNVERANIAQIAIHQVHRSGGSELFWHDMINACGYGLFGKDPDLSNGAKEVYVMIFALMANLVKVASGKVRTTSAGVLLTRDVASKKLSLELLLHFLEYWNDEQEAVGEMLLQRTHSGRPFSTDTLAYAVRRMVVPCLLSNTRAALLDKDIFRRVLRIVSELWRSPINRSHCKAELGVLIDHFCVHFLLLGPRLKPDSRYRLAFGENTVSLYGHQLEILRQLKSLFHADPKDVILMFLNYDTDLATDASGSLQPMPGTRWKLFQRLCSAISLITEQCGEVIAQQIEEHRAKLHSIEDGPPEPDPEDLSNAEKGALRESARKLRTASLECIAAIVRALAICSGVSTGHQFATMFVSWGDVDLSAETLKILTNGLGNANDLQMVSADNESNKQIVPFDASSKATLEGSAVYTLDVAVGIAVKKGLKKAVDYLVACGALTPAPRAIATYLRLHKDRFDPAELGRYLGETGVDAIEKEYWNSIRHSFVRAISFLGMNLDEALRHFLTHCGFRLPGEAQKVDRIVNTFAECFFEDNAGDALLCPFPNEDEVYLICFALIMLNTDLHKASDRSARGKKKMTKQDFVSNIKGAGQGTKISKEYLYSLYESIEKHPIVLEEEKPKDDRQRELTDIMNNIQSADSLLRGLAVHDFRFATIEDVARSSRSSSEAASRDITRQATEKTWHHWHSVISTCLETAHLDLQAMESCADLLLYALSTAVCLNLTAPKAAFLGLLGRLKSFEELRQGRWIGTPDFDSFRREEWYLELEEAISGDVDRKVWALRNIHEWMGSVQTEIFDDVKNKAELTKAVAGLEDGDVFLQDPARSFIRSGPLIKKSGRTGRVSLYHFFLFSDLLLYAREDGDAKMKIHEELPLHQLKVTDWFPTSQKNREQMFEIHHPRKRFAVLCNSTEEKKSWVADIRKAILNEVERKMKMEAARLAVHSKAR